VHLAAVLAADPETQAPAVHLWPGLRYRFSFAMDDLFDGYLLARLDFPVGSDPFQAGAVAPGIGAGVRLARTASIEGSFMFPIGLLEPIELADTRSHVWGAFGVTISVDLCRLGVDCEPPAPVQQSRDCTGDLYARAHATCVVATPSAHAKLCEAVMRALDGAAHPPRQEQDSTEAFLRALLDELAPEPNQGGIRGRVASIDATHVRFRMLLDAQREAARTAARDERTLRYVTNYAPSAVELRRVLGCYPTPDSERCPTPTPVSDFARWRCAR
jgi:hypothetical protein